MTLIHKNKIGIGGWETTTYAKAIKDIKNIGFNWYYNWTATPLKGSQRLSQFVPMIWGAANVDADVSAHRFLLGFNEPDNAEQANMTVETALTHWPTLVEKGKKLGSPATTTNQTFGENSWLGLFMYYVDTSSVDFIAVHYYTDNPSVTVFKEWLQTVRDAYGKPIWVTEWGLINWENMTLYDIPEIKTFVRESCLMMDRLPFVQRHAWFALYPYSYNETPMNLNLYEGNTMTELGKQFKRLIRRTK